MAFIANTGDFYSLIVSHDFHNNIIVKDETYDSFTQLFMNRFDKQRLKFEDTYQNINVIRELTKLYRLVCHQSHLSE